MSSKQIVRITNVIGIISILLLLYWVVGMITIEAFGLKVFKKNLSEIFFSSITGILALMSGALILNIMFNLSRIADRYESPAKEVRTPKKMLLLLVLLFPLLIGWLFWSDHHTVVKKKTLMCESVREFIDNKQIESSHLLNYSFDKNYINECQRILNIAHNSSSELSQAEVIVRDTIGSSPVYLSFCANLEAYNLKHAVPMKKDFIRYNSRAERNYLESVFSNANRDIYFTANNGYYELYFPFVQGSKRVVIYCSDSYNYGK